MTAYCAATAPAVVTEQTVDLLLLTYLLYDYAVKQILCQKRQWQRGPPQYKRLLKITKQCHFAYAVRNNDSAPSPGFAKYASDCLT